MKTSIQDSDFIHEPISRFLQFWVQMRWVEPPQISLSVIIYLLVTSNTIHILDFSSMITIILVVFLRF